MRPFFYILGVLILLSSCNSVENKEYAGKQEDTVGPMSVHPKAEYFYPFDTIPKVYLYRDAVRGLAEEFHRVYGIEDGFGAHIVVEKYEADGRFKGVFNYNLDSLDIIDHVVINFKGEKEKAILYEKKKELFPQEIGDSCEFACKFSLSESSIVLMEWFRKTVSIDTMNVMSRPAECITVSDIYRYTELNPFTGEEETPFLFTGRHYYAKGIGLVEWMSEDKKVHWVLEDIISQKKWINLLSR